MLRRALALVILGSFVFLACSDDQDPSASALSSPRRAKDAGGSSSSGSGGSSSSGGSSGTPGDPPPTPTDPAGFCKAYMDTSLSAVTTCCPNDVDAPIVQVLKGFQDLALPQCTDRLTKSLANNRIAYDPAKASSCLTAMTVTKAQCPGTGTATVTKSADCELAYRGLVPEGGACDGDIECAGGVPCQGAVCQKAATTAGADCKYPDGEADPGIFEQRKRCIDGEICFGGNDRCAPLAKTGEKCNSKSDCVEGDTCVGTFPDKACQPIVKQESGGDCEDDDSCKDGLSCQGGKCTPRKNAGESCTETIANGTECKGYCDGATDTTPGTCHSFCGSP